MDRDFSNFDEIINFLLDDAELQNVVEMAYQDIIISNLYSSSILGRGIDGTIDLIRNKKQKKLCVE